MNSRHVELAQLRQFLGQAMLNSMPRLTALRRLPVAHGLGAASKRVIACCVCLLLTGCGATSDADKRPNVLLIVVDDLGYTDLGAFGGEIPTPNLDNLARSGLRLTNFHTSASCSPTRAMLLTGTDNHLAGVGSQGSLTTPLQSTSPAYRNALSPEVPTVAEHFSQAGYRTFAVAKWHLGNQPESMPGRRGFDRSFVLTQGGGGHFDNAPLFEEYGVADWREDDQPTLLPADFHSTATMTDKLIEYLRHSETEQPFFAYLGYTAPHWPLQAPAATIRKYEGQYDQGWEALRDARMAGARREGVVASTAEAVDWEPGMRDWATLDADERARNARTMEVYAAMVDELDQHIGRLLEYLAATGKLSNTLIVFLSDNGAEAHQMELRANRDGWIDRNYDNSIAAIGTAESYVTLGPGWARATAAPFRDSKSKMSEGGIRTPAFIHLPEGQAGVSDAYVSVMDLAPTLLDLAGAPMPKDILGRSQIALLNGGASAYGPEDVIAMELYGRRAARRDNWKVLLQEEPYGTGQWQLYDLRADPGEQNDLSERFPEIRDELIAAWQNYADQVGVVLPETPVPY